MDPFTIYVSGKYAYIANAVADSLEIVDISNPTNPRHAGKIIDGTGGASMDYASRVYVSGKYAYVTGSLSETLEIVDISSSTNPTHAGLISNGDGGADMIYPYSVQVSGKYAYVASDSSIEVVDISSSTNPTHAGLISDGDGGAALSINSYIFISGKYAYVTASDSGALEILDISGIDAPSATIGDIAAGSIDIWENANIFNDLAVGNSLNVGQGGLYSQGNVSIFASSTASSTLISALSVTQNGTGDLFSLYNSSTQVFRVANNGNVGINTTSVDYDLNISGSLNIITPSALYLNGVNYSQYFITSAGAIGQVWRSDGSGLGRWENTSTFGFPSGGNMSLTPGSVAFASSSGGLTEDNNNLFWDNTNSRLGISTNTPSDRLTLNGGNFKQGVSDLAIVGGIVDGTNLNGAIGVFVSGKYAYVANLVDDSLRIIDISNPSVPTIVGGIKSSSLNGVDNVYVSGKYAYLISYAGDLFKIVDISNPGAPVLKGGITSTSGLLNAPSSIYISGKYAYITEYDAMTFSIVDISNPDNPRIAGILASPELNSPRSVFVSGRYAYIACFGNDSVQIVDISSSTKPLIVGGIEDSVNLNGAYSVYVSGKYAYVAGYVSNMMSVIDISSSTNPLVVGVSSGVSIPFSLQVSGRYAYVASYGSDSLDVIDVSSSTNPFKVSGISSSTVLDQITSVDVSGKYAYVVGYNSDSFQIIDIGGIDAPSATIGDLAVGSIDVSENVNIYNDLMVGNGLNIGGSGLYSQGVLSLSGSSLNYGNVYDSMLSITQSGNGDIVAFFNSSSQLFTISDNGQVQINTTSTLEALNVNGAIRLGNSDGKNDGTVRWSGSDFEAYISNQWISLTNVGKTNPGTFYAYDQDGGNSISTSASLIPLDTEIKKDSIYTHETNSSTITINETGWYQLFYYAGFDDLSTGDVANIYLGKSTGGAFSEIAGSRIPAHAYSATYDSQSAMGSVYHQFNAGDQVRFQAIITAGSAATTIASTTGMLIMKAQDYIPNSVPSLSISTGGVIFKSGTSTLETDASSLFWDNTNKRLGIGTNTPSDTLTLAGGNFEQISRDPVHLGKDCKFFSIQWCL